MAHEEDAAQDPARVLAALNEHTATKIYSFTLAATLLMVAGFAVVFALTGSLSPGLPRLLELGHAGIAWYRQMLPNGLMSVHAMGLAMTALLILDVSNILRAINNLYVLPMTALDDERYFQTLVKYGKFTKHNWVNYGEYILLVVAVFQSLLNGGDRHIDLFILLAIMYFRCIALHTPLLVILLAPELRYRNRVIAPNYDYSGSLNHVSMSDTNMSLVVFAGALAGIAAKKRGMVKRLRTAILSEKEAME